MDVLFLTLDEVLEIHRDQIDRYGGAAGVRDNDLLASALSMSQATFGDRFLHDDLFAMASAYLFHLVQNHPFIDGNKRVGTAAALTFLILNGRELSIPNQALVQMVLAVAQGKLDKAAIAEFFRTYAPHID